MLGEGGKMRKRTKEDSWSRVDRVAFSHDNYDTPALLNLIREWLDENPSFKVLDMTYDKDAVGEVIFVYGYIYTYEEKE
jgi:hypothetical protein